MGMTLSNVRSAPRAEATGKGREGVNHDGRSPLGSSNGRRCKVAAAVAASAAAAAVAAAAAEAAAVAARCPLTLE